MTNEDSPDLATEVLVKRIRDEIIPLFDRLIAGGETYFANPHLETLESFADEAPLHCPGSRGQYERCWQTVGEYRRQPSPDMLCFPHDCKECPVYQGACPTVVEELGEAFNNMVYLLHRKEETVQNAMNFTRNLAKEVDRCRNRKQELSLLMLDIDFFKSYNDQYGHLQGDRMLERFGRLLRAAIRDTDQAFRFGGEEFVVLLPGTDGEDAYRVADRIRERFATLVFNVPPHSRNPEGRESRTVSIGVAAYADDMEAEKLLETADQALYQAKNSGRNCVVSRSLQPVG